MASIHHIVEGCKKKDHKYQKILYEKYYGYALKTVFRYIYYYDKAVDIANDGFVKLFNSFHKFKCEDPGNAEIIMMGWIRRIMINTAIDELRRTKLLREIGDLPEYIWTETNKGYDADKQLLYKDILQITKRLPPVYRIVFNMYVIDGCTHHEIADALRISVGASKSNLSRSRMLLQKFIKEQEETEYGEYK